MNNDINKTLNERGEVYGDFDAAADIYQQLKKVVDDNSQLLSNRQRYALDQMMIKVTRILNGDPSHEDNWRDAAGYALLGGGLYKG